MLIHVNTNLLPTYFQLDTSLYVNMLVMLVRYASPHVNMTITKLTSMGNTN